MGALSLLVAAPLLAASASPIWHATITDVSGVARIQVPGADWKIAETGGRLEQGDTIATLELGRARLEFTDGSRVSLGPRTMLKVSAPRGHRLGLSLLRGVARFLVQHRVGGELIVTTPTAVAAVKGTLFAIAVDGDVTEIRVAEGEVLCRDRALRYAVLMRPGEAAQWDDRGLWKPVRRMDAGETAAVADDDTAPPAAALDLPGHLRLGGYVTENYTVLRNAGSTSDPRLALSPRNPLQATRGRTLSGFSNPWLSLAAASRLGERARTTWELWLTQGGSDPRPGANNYHGRIELLNACASADLVRLERGPSPLALRAGVFQAPLGLLNQDVSLPRRTFAHLPLFASRMIPVPYQDLGAELSGGAELGFGTLRYQAAVLNGLQVEPDEPWQALRVEADGLWWARPAEDERSFGADNNASRALAGRIGFGTPTVGLGVSGYSGKADKGNVHDVKIVTGDLSLSAELSAVRLSLRIEGGQAGLQGPSGMFLGWPETGFYYEAEAASLRWPVSLGVGESNIIRNLRDGAPKQIGEWYAAVAWRFVPEMAFKVEARRVAVEGVTPPLDAFTAQVSAFW